MKEANPKQILLVLGGVRSGKSRYAQSYADRYPRVAGTAETQP
jgi:adenosyl cobinamide kinase/adenosyl cobinamide phosphate guanylyltransferase